MASPKSSKKKRRPLLLGRAMLHSCLCFLLGLLIGLTPSDWTDAASRAAANANAVATKQVFRALHAVRATINNNGSSSSSTSEHLMQPQVVVVVTTTGASERERRSAGLTRTAHALRLVSPPLLWLVVEAAQDAAGTALLLRRTGLVYRHVTYNSSESESELQHHQRQRTLALAHIEQHRLRGVVFFAGLADVYDIRLLDQLRTIRAFGAWAVATVWENRVDVQGPLCSPAGAAGRWFSFSSTHHRLPVPVPADIDAHGFAFRSDLLLDPARWDRFPTSEPDQSQDSLKFVQRLLLLDEDYKPINCSQIMAWRVDTALLL